MSAATDYTIDELLAVCISRQIEDGECLAQGIATPLVIAGYYLAKLTHAPNLMFATAVGSVLTDHWAPLSLGRAEFFLLRHALAGLSFVQAACEVLPTFAFKEFLRPAQVDPHGNFNNVVIGDYHKPRLRLPGSGGIPDLTCFSSRVYLYVPRHGRTSFVPQLDFTSGVGVRSDEERRRLGIRGSGPRYLLTDLGQFDFAGGRMRLVTYHPGVTIERIQARTGFPLDVSPDAAETEPPSQEDVRLLREVIDPLATRRLETASGPDRWALLRRIAEKEREVSDGA